MKAKIRVSDIQMETFSKARKCLEIGRDLTRLQVSLNLLEMSTASSRKKYAGIAKAEIRRFGERYPLSKPDLKAASSMVRKAAGGSVKGMSVRGSLGRLAAAAETSCS